MFGIGRIGHQECQNADRWSEPRGYPVLTGDELRERAVALRSRSMAVDERLVEQLESDVQEYRRHWADSRSSAPTPELAERLPLIGWLIYEASFWVLQRVQAA